MFNTTPITIVPPGYKPDLDRIPAGNQTNCRKLFVWSLVLIIILGCTGIGGVMFFTLTQPDIMPTLVPLQSIVEIEPSPTLNYCWYLTPTIEYIPVTPDSWGLEGTRISQLTPSPSPTPAPPKELCDSPGWQTSEPTQPPGATATWTPYGIPTGIPTFIPPTLGVEPTEEILPTTLVPVLPTAIPTATVFPTLRPIGSDNPGSNPAPQPVTVIEYVNRDVVIIQTVVKVKTETLHIIVTATPQPPTPTIVPSATVTPLVEITEELQPPTATVTPTIVPSATVTPLVEITEELQPPTATVTPTIVPSATPTDIPTLTYTPTPTATVTPTLIPTSTLFPTLEGSDDA